jgi:hypothetical protein
MKSKITQLLLLITLSGCGSDSTTSFDVQEAPAPAPDIECEKRNLSNGQLTLCSDSSGYITQAGSKVKIVETIKPCGSHKLTLYRLENNVIIIIHKNTIYRLNSGWYDYLYEHKCKFYINSYGFVYNENY